MYQLNNEQVVQIALDLIINRFKTEQPDRVLLQSEIENIQFDILGKLNRGETEQEVIDWCKTVPLNKKCIHRPVRNVIKSRKGLKYMKSKQCGCNFCNDLRNIQPAKYIGGGDEEFENWIEKVIEAKQFILILDDGVYIIDKCPMCGYVFTEDDYDNYKGL